MFGDSAGRGFSSQRTPPGHLIASGTDTHRLPSSDEHRPRLTSADQGFSALASTCPVLTRAEQWYQGLTGAHQHCQELPSSVQCYPCLPSTDNS